MIRRVLLGAPAVFFWIAFSLGDLHGQPSPTPAPSPELYSAATLADLEKLRQAALTSDFAYRQVAHLSNNIGPRLSGSAQAQKAVEYVAGEMRKIGCDVRLEKAMVPHWVRGAETAALVQFPGQAANTTQKIVLTALGGSVATPAEGLTAEVVVVRDFDELNSLGKEKVAGKIVVFNYPFDRQLAAEGHGGEAYGEAVTYRSNGAIAAAKLGAVAALNRSAGGAAYRLPHTGAMHYEAGMPQIPAAAVTDEDAELLAHLAQQGVLRMHLTVTPQTLPDVESANVVADLKGSERPEQVVIVSGHLDSWDLGTGAIDDGAGVAAAMAAVKIVRQLGLHPRRTIRAVAWMDEEHGTRGGAAYSRAHAPESANHFAAIETDLGADHPLGINFVGKRELREFLKPVAKILAANGAGLLAQRDEAGADIDGLARLGVPNFSPIQDSRFYFNYHHTAADTLDKIDPHQLAETVAINAVLAYALANLEQPLPR